MVPFGRNPQFIGQEDELDRLENMILSRDHAQKAAIAGLGGVGKTQIALELAYCIRNQDLNHFVF